MPPIHFGVTSPTWRSPHKAWPSFHETPAGAYSNKRAYGMKGTRGLGECGLLLWRNGGASISKGTASISKGDKCIPLMSVSYR